MIETSLTRVKIHEVVQSQIPESIDSESPLFGEFMKQYYLSQEYQGGTIDIAENLVEYKGLDVLNNNNLIGFASVSQYIGGRDNIIYVDSTNGWPASWGLLKINDEIITYTGIGSTSFTGCQRAFSGIENNQKTNSPEFLTFTNSGLGTHGIGAKVTNLSNVFLQTFLKKLKKQVLPGFSERPLNEKVNQNNFIRQAKDFFSTKGTEESFKILFGALYGEEVEMLQPARYMIRPSSADYLTNDVILAKAKRGNALKIDGQTISQGNGISASVYSVESTIVGIHTFYTIRLSQDTTFGAFQQTNKTFVTREIPSGATVLDVDSTVGFGTAGYFSMGDFTYQYTDKNYTQFIGITSTTAVTAIGSTVTFGADAISYEDGDLTKPVSVEVVGILSKFVGNSVNQQRESIINVKQLGNIETDNRFTTWIQNSTPKHTLVGWKVIAPGKYQLDLSRPHDFLVDDTFDVVDPDNNINPATIVSIIDSTSIVVTTAALDPTIVYFIRRNLKLQNNYTANVQATYRDPNDAVFVASNSLPHWPINASKRSRTLYPFLKQFGTELEIIDHHFADGDIVTYNSVQGPKLENLIEGDSYYVKRINGNKLSLAFTSENVRNGNYIVGITTSDSNTNTEHSFTPVQFVGKENSPQSLLRKFPVATFDEISPISAPGPIGLFANGVEIHSYKSTEKVFYGALNTIDILNSGSNYDIINPPRLSVSQSGHTGLGASCVAQVKGTLKEILVDTEGVDYQEMPLVTINGGNYKGSAVIIPQLKIVPQEIEFDATSAGGVVNTEEDRFQFKAPHGFKPGEAVIYTTGGTTEIGIGTTPGNLIDGNPYYVVVKDEFEIMLSESPTKAIAGIGTIPIDSNGAGVHKLSTIDRRNKLDKIYVDQPGTFYNRTLRVTSGTVGINTFIDAFYYPNHGFVNGDQIRYEAPDAIAVGGLNKGSDYYCRKIDEDSFRLATVEDGDSYVSLLSNGSGSHFLSDPPIFINIVGRQGITTANATATPIIRGDIIGAEVTENGTRFGSIVINDNHRPEINVIEGKNTYLQPFIVNGRIEQIIIKAGGQDFFNIPDIIISGDGVGAKAKAIVSNGEVVDIVMIEKGANYTQARTTAKAVTPGYGALFSANVKTWTINNVDRFAKLGDVQSDDGFYGSPRESKFGLPYINYYVPRQLRSYLGDEGIEHSPILGYAYDGNPIYGPYAFSGTNGGSLKYMQSSYVKVTGQRFDGPQLLNFPAGFFVEDYKYVPGSGDLDEHNGRFAVTPEYPNGIYAYYTTVSTNLVSNAGDPFHNARSPIFPYVVGDSYRSKIESKNFDFDFDQRQDPTQYGVVKNTKSFNITEYEFISNANRGSDIQSRILSTEQGSIETVKIIESGQGYYVGDSLSFNNTDTNGFGAIAKISKIVGPEVSTLESNRFELDGVEFIFKEGQVTGITTLPHNLGNNSFIQVSDLSSPIHIQMEGIHQIVVKNVTSGISTQLSDVGANAGITTSIRVFDNVNIFEVDDIIQVDNEQMKVFEIDNLQNQIDLIRAVNGTVSAAHTFGATIQLLPTKFEYRIPFVPATPNNYTVYFDAGNQVGLGLSYGAVNNHTVDTVDFGQQTIPTRSLFIPRHSFQPGDKIKYNSDNGARLNYQPTTGAGGTASGWTSPLPDSNLFVQVLSQNTIGIVTTFAGIGSADARVMYYPDQTGIGNTHFFKTDRGAVTGKVSTTNVLATTKEAHSLRPLDTIEMTLVSAATSSVALVYNPGNRFVSIGNSANPRINVTRGDTLEFDISDASMLATKIQFFLDPKYHKEFVGSGNTTPQVTYSGIPGNAGAKATVSMNSDAPEILFYKINSLEVSKTIDENIDIDDHNKIVVNNSIYTASGTISTVGSDQFTFNIFREPERVGYTTQTANIDYLTNTTNDAGPIGAIEITSGGLNYRDIPQVSIASTSGTSALVRPSGSMIGKLREVNISGYGYDYPSDKTLRPEASVPQVIYIKDNFTITDVGITSAGKKYLTPPDLVIYNSKTDQISDTTKFRVDLQGSGVSAVKIISGGGNLRSGDNKIVAINNTNGVGIVSASYAFPNVTLTLKTPQSGFTNSVPIPFVVGDKVFVENVGVTTGHGYNSADFGYQSFELTEVNANLNVFNGAFIKYQTTQNPGAYDNGQFGSVANAVDIAQFEAVLKESEFDSGETIHNESDASAKIVFGKGKRRNVLRVDTVEGFEVGDKITAELSNSGGTIEYIDKADGHFETGIVHKGRFGWETDTGKLSDVTQRIQDSDYYQQFSYSLKSKIGISSWSEPVDSLAHIAGFKKHSDMLINSSVVGLGTTSIISIAGDGGDAKAVVLIESEDKLSCFKAFDTGFEEPNPTNTTSDNIVFTSTRFGATIISNTNRVLDIDDISPQFYNDPDVIRAVIIDTFPGGDSGIDPISGIKYHAQVVLDESLGLTFNTTQFCEFIVFSDGTDSFINQYSDLSDSFDLGEFIAEMSGNDVIVKFQPFNNTFTYDITFYKEELPRAVTAGIGSTSFSHVEKIGLSSAFTASGSPTTVSLHDIDGTKFRSGLIVVAHETSTETEMEEYNFLMDGANNVIYSDYGNMDTNFTLGDFDMDNASNVLSLTYTPAANQAVDVHLMVTQVGVAQTAQSNVSNISTLSVGDSELEGAYVEIGSSATPSNTPISIKDTGIFTSVKYFIQIHNTTDDEYSAFTVAGNSTNGNLNYNTYNNLSNASNQKRDIRNVEMDLDGNNMRLMFMPLANKEYVCRTYEIRLDRPDNIAQDTTINL